MNIQLASGFTVPRASATQKASPFTVAQDRHTIHNSQLLRSCGVVCGVWCGVLFLGNRLQHYPRHGLMRSLFGSYPRVFGTPPSSRIRQHPRHGMLKSLFGSYPRVFGSPPSSRIRQQPRHGVLKRSRLTYQVPYRLTYKLTNKQLHEDMNVLSAISAAVWPS